MLKGLDVLSKWFPVRFYDGEESSPAGSAGSAVADPPASPPAAPENNDPILPEISADDDFKKAVLENDPEYADILKQAAPKKEKAQEENPDKEEKVEETPAEDEKKTEEEPPAPSFEDNVIEGLKGEDFGKMSDEGQLAVAKFHEKYEQASTENKELTDRLQKLLEDPVVKLRDEAIKSGDPDLNFRSAGFTPSERDTVKAILQEFGLDKSEAEEVMTRLSKGLDAIVRQDAERLAYGVLSKKESERQVNEVTQKGREVLMGLGKFNNELALEGVTLDELFKLGPKHPKWGQYEKSGLKRAVDWLSARKIGYHQLAEMGPEAAYGMVAGALKLPVALNTGERDKKLIAAEKEKTLRRFLKSEQPKSLAGNPPSGDRKEAEKLVMDSGYDIVRLASDPNYYESQMTRTFGNREKVDKLNSLVEKGRRIIAAQRSKKK